MRKIPYATQWLDNEDVKAVIKALTLTYLTQGPLVKKFEEKVAAYCGAKYAVAVNSGTAALHIACLASEISSKDEVITSPITFVASANCILYCNGKPVFADVQKDTINIDPEEIKKKITGKTKAIIPVHFAGHPCDLKDIYDIAKKNNLIVIEDAAHALGAQYKRSKIGSCKYSDMTVFSYHAVKHITTGEGGMITTNNEKLYKKLLMYRSHGITRERALLKNKHIGNWYYEMQFLGFNYRLTDFQCALGISQLTKIGNFIARRRLIVEKYNKAFSAQYYVTLPIEKQGCCSSWHIYPIRVQSNRKKVFNKLRESGIGVNVHYLPVYRQPYYCQLGYKANDCPQADDYYEQAITLPLYPKMSDNDVSAVIMIVSSVLKEYCS